MVHHKKRRRWLLALTTVALLLVWILSIARPWSGELVVAEPAGADAVTGTEPAAPNSPGERRSFDSREAARAPAGSNQPATPAPAEGDVALVIRGVPQAECRVQLCLPGEARDAHIEGDRWIATLPTLAAARSAEPATRDAATTEWSWCVRCGPALLLHVEHVRQRLLLLDVSDLTTVSITVLGLPTGARWDASLAPTGTLQRRSIGTEELWECPVPATMRVDQGKATACTTAFSGEMAATTELIVPVPTGASFEVAISAAEHDLEPESAELQAPAQLRAHVRAVARTIEIVGAFDAGDLVLLHTPLLKDNAMMRVGASTSSVRLAHRHEDPAAAQAVFHLAHDGSVRSAPVVAGQQRVPMLAPAVAPRRFGRSGNAAKIRAAHVLRRGIWQPCSPIEDPILVVDAWFDIVADDGDAIRFSSTDPSWSLGVVVLEDGSIARIDGTNVTWHQAEPTALRVPEDVGNDSQSVAWELRLVVPNVPDLPIAAGRSLVGALREAKIPVCRPLTQRLWLQPLQASVEGRMVEPPF
jgi:hypothetical protein